MQNNQNFYRNGYPRYDSFPTSSRSYGVRNDRYERWHEEDDDWSTPRREETWRGDSRRNPGSRAAEERRRSDSWKSGSPRDFRHGKDRAPMPIDDEFLDRYGAKRLNNGNLVDRDGYTLRTRDPDCRAPSPPTFNPGREMRRSGDGKPPPGLANRLSEEDLDKKARQQIEMMNRMATTQQKDEEKNEKKQRNERKRRNPDEGEDEYEEVEEPPVKETPIETSNPYCNNIKKALLTSPPSSSESFHHSSNYLGKNPRNIPYRPAISQQKSWFQEYKQRVDTLKEQTYGPSPSLPAATPGYFFKSQPTLSTSSGASTTSPGAPFSSTSSPYYAVAATSSSSYLQNPQNVNPFGVPRDVPIPDVVYPPSTPTPPGATSRYANQYLNGISVASSATMNPFGVWSGNSNDGIQQLAHAPPPPPPPEDRRRDSSDSDSEDEAMTKLRQIIENYGSKR
ncbi:hypothetical protein GCK72_004041 [Caenorhabditis remanei]|uniref:Uncharacterized protein n=1 Tax=Caenorhabditis remanei TaxID=31234 RepID=A0A6A5HA83_CAERE|nr:hypothetical protein GCK72_004041 [Caenorhabditis remanei]KAF1764095.1 hypothetical protein GCK72_004041 [Caenorhabditis remanei]